MEFRLPELGEGVTEGELVKWRVAVGETVKDDQPLCEIMTDKATVEIPSPFHGVITELSIKEGEIVKVHQLMLKANAEGKGGAAHAPTAPHVAPAAPHAVKAHIEPPAKPVAPMSAPNVTTSGDVLASPATRRMAREKGVNLGTVAASGPHGRVLMDDIIKALNGGPGSGATSAGMSRLAPAQLGALEERTPIRGIRKKISEKMRLSKDKAAHFTYVEEADATNLVKLRTRAKEIGEKQGVKVTYLPFILKAMVAALKKHPRLNSTVDEASNEIVTKRYYNIAISVQTEDGLTVPVVKHVEQKGIFELAKEINDLVNKARNKKLAMDDLQGSTITLTNAGSIGGLFATPIINYPEVAILGFNKIFKKVVPREVKGRYKLAVRDWTYFSISLDHRIIDGAEAAEFLKTFIEYIENPALMVLE